MSQPKCAAFGKQECWTPPPWIYDEPSGLLTRKEYADGEGTDYLYDSANRLTSTGLFDSSYITNELNQHTEVSVSPSPREPVHDADVNLVDNGAGWTYSWNAENRLIQATNPAIGACAST